MEDSHQPGIEVEGNVELARVINSSVNALLGAYREDAFPGAGFKGIISDTLEIFYGMSTRGCFPILIFYFLASHVQSP